MAESGREQELRNAVLVPVHYETEDCYCSPLPSIMFPAFRVEPTATSDDFSVTVIYIEGKAAGNLVTVLFKHKGNSSWHLMTRTHGATWKSPDTTVTAPPSFRVSMPMSAGAKPNPKVVTTEDVIPANWQPGATYYPKV
jgi:hypothetical protein